MHVDPGQHSSTPHHLPVYFGHHAFNTTEMQGTLYHISTQAAVSSYSHLDAQLPPTQAPTFSPLFCSSSYS